MTDPATGPGTARGAGRGAAPRSRLTAGSGASALPAYSALRDALAAQTWLLYHADVQLLQQPAQGDFPWWYLNGDQVFNAATYDWVSARVVPGDADGLVALTASGGFPAAYATLLGDLTWTVVPADAGSPTAATRRAAALAEVARLRAVLADPPAGAGGMRTVDPVTGAVPPGTVPAYGVGVSLAALAAALQGGGSTIVVRVPGPAGSTVTITYPGCVMVPVAPAAWQPTTGSGWYASDPVAQALARGPGAPSGFAFASPPPWVPGPVADGGDLGQVVGVLLSGPRQVDVLPGPAGDADGGGAPDGPGPTDLELEVLAALELLGVDEAELGLDPDLVAGLDAAPEVAPGAGPTVPLLQQRATVVGVVVGTWPGPAGS